MGFNMRSWSNPITLDSNNLNRIEQGIKNAHDTLEITNEEVSNLQNKQAQIVKDLNTLTKDAPNILETLTKVTTLLNNNDISAILSSSDTFLTKTKQTLSEEELKRVHKNLALDNFLKLTSIKVNGVDVVSGSKVNITLPTIDTALNINSTNAISNKAVALAIQNVSLNKNIPVYLSELLQDNNHMTVSRDEKVKWNSFWDLIKDINIEESDPTVPSWAKKPNKPVYLYSEIIDTPTKLSAFTNDMDFTTNAYVDSEITKLTNTLLGPDGDAALDTITELASAIADNSDIISTLNQAITNKADTTALSSVTNATISSDSKTLTITKRDGTSFDFQGGSDLSNYVTKDGFTMRASSNTVGRFYYNTGAGEKSITVKMPTIPVKSVNGLTGDVVIDLSNYITTNTAQKIEGAKYFSGTVGNIQTEAGIYLGLDENTGAENANMAIVSANTAAYIDMGRPGVDYDFRIIKWNTADNKHAQFVYSGNAAGTITIPQASGTMALTSDVETRLALNGSNTMTGKLNLKATGANETNIGSNGIRWNLDSLPQSIEPEYVCVIDGFAIGGRQKWSTVLDVHEAMRKVVTPNWHVSQDGSGNLVFTYS